MEVISSHPVHTHGSRHSCQRYTSAYAQYMKVYALPRRRLYMCVHISTRSRFTVGEVFCNLSNSDIAQRGPPATEAKAHAQTCAQPSLTRPSEAAQNFGNPPPSPAAAPCEIGTERSAHTDATRECLCPPGICTHTRFTGRARMIRVAS